MAKAKCRNCGKKPASRPTYAPTFCTFRCALDFSMRVTDGEEWCESCQEWHEDGQRHECDILDVKG